MNEQRSNAHRLLELFEMMRHGRSGAGLRRLGALNLSFSHLRAMHMLAPDRTLAMKDLAERLEMTPPSITALTRRLVQTGLVRRQPDPEDSRVAHLSLTDEGRRLLRQLYEEQIRRMELLLQGLSPEEQRLFIDLLERAVRAMRAETPEGLDDVPPTSAEARPAPRSDPAAS